MAGTLMTSGRSPADSDFPGTGSHHENSVTQAGQVFSKKMNRARDATDMRQVRVGKHADVHPQSLYNGNVF